MLSKDATPWLPGVGAIALSKPTMPLHTSGWDIKGFGVLNLLDTWFVTTRHQWSSTIPNLQVSGHKRSMIPDLHLSNRQWSMISDLQMTPEINATWLAVCWAQEIHYTWFAVSWTPDVLTLHELLCLGVQPAELLPSGREVFPVHTSNARCGWNICIVPRYMVLPVYQKR